MPNDNPNSADPSKMNLSIDRSMNRRSFLQTATVAGAAGAVACTYDPKMPVENILPYVNQPEDALPGTATYYATACDECANRCGMVARNKDGRAVMVEGNPDHAESLGLCTRGHFGLLATYSPDRLAGPTRDRKALTWEDADSAVIEAIRAAKTAGKKVAWLGRYRTGSVAALLDGLQKGMGLTRLHWEPLGVENLLTATRSVFGLDTLPAYELSGAHTILSFGMDFLGSAIGSAHMRKGWSKARDPRHGDFVTRLVCVEPRLSQSSSQADVWLAPTPGTEAQVALAIAKAAAAKKGYSGPASGLLSGVDIGAAAGASGISEARIQEIAGWLTESPAVALPGGHANSGKDGAALAIASLIINEVIGAVGKTLSFGREYRVGPVSSYADVKQLLADAAAGQVGVLILDGVNPVFNTPADDNAAAALAKVDLLIQLANEPDESSTGNALILPPGTNLEVWGDGEAMSGVHSLQQPAMVARKDVRAAGDLLLKIGAALVPAAPPPVASAPPVPTDAPPAGAVGVPPVAAPVQAPLGFGFATFRDYIQARWRREVIGDAGFDAAWVSALQRGGHFVPRAVVPAGFMLPALPQVGAAQSGAGMALVVFPGAFLHDGRHANIPWAQELPDPISTYTWTTWVEIHPKQVEKLGLGAEDKVKVTVGGKSIEVGYFASPGVREDTVAVGLGNGRREGRYAKGRGADVMALLGSEADAQSGAFAFYGARAQIARAGGGSDAFALCGSMNQDGRPIALNVAPEASVKAVQDGTKKTIVKFHTPPVDERLKKQGILDMYPEPQHPTYRFGLSIDLNSCNGCMACVVACNLENNIPWVGPDQIRKGRGMSWIRMDRFFEGEGETPDVRYLPSLCQHCSHAPCEGVCPVLATYHNLDGLNAMIYNRCVGTRYCANNCPYTARRFNYHTWSWPDAYKLMLNPDILVREMGVMEKCTFCVQRVRSVKDSWRDLHDKDNLEASVVPDAALQKLTACASACPTGAITFGNAKDAEGEVGKKFADPRVYTLLGELNTKPGVRYLARVRHGHVDAGHGGGGHGGAKAGAHGGEHGAGKGDADHGNKAGHGEASGAGAAHGEAGKSEH